MSQAQVGLGLRHEQVGLSNSKISVDGKSKSLKGLRSDFLGLIKGQTLFQPLIPTKDLSLLIKKII